MSNLFSRNLTSVEEALKRGENINQQEKSSTPLLEALSNKRDKIATFLIQNGADVNSVRILKDGHIRSPLVECTSEFYEYNDESNYDVLEILLKHGANPNQAETVNGYTPLTKALEKKDRVEIAKMLTEYGADVNLKDNKGRLPLAMAIECEDLELTKLLLDEGAEFSIQKVFLKAIKRKNLKIIQLLIERGAKLNLRSISGKTPLTYALAIGNVEIFHLLINTGADVNLSDASGDTPLTQAIKLGRIKMVELLCQNGVDLGRDFPIKTAVDAKNLNILKYLIEMGADFNVIGNNGCTPLTAAVEEHDFGLVKLLLDRGADVNQVDDNQKTAFSLVVAKKNLRIAKYLEERGATVECVSEIKEIANEDEDWKIHFENLL